MGMEYFAFDMGQAFKPKKMFVGGLIIGDDGKTKAVRSEFFKAFVSTKPTLIFLDELTRTPMVAANLLDHGRRGCIDSGSVPEGVS